MKKLILKILDLLINGIEEYEDYSRGYHIDLDTGKYAIGKYVFNKKV